MKIKKTKKIGRMKSLWNGESWDKVETKKYRVSEENGESKEIQRNREVMRTGQEKGIGQELRTTKVGHAFFILDRPEKTWLWWNQT